MSETIQADLLEAIRLLRLMQSKMMYQEPAVASFLAKFDTVTEPPGVPTCRMEALTSGDWCINFTEEKDPAASIQKFLKWCDVVGLKWVDGSKATECGGSMGVGQYISSNARYIFSRPEWNGRLTWGDEKRRHARITIPFSSLIPPE